jgi:hypothetical protein
MNKFGKVVLGFLTIWPILYIILFILFICSMVMVPVLQKEAPESNGPGYSMIALFGLHGLTMLIGIFLFAFYIIHAARNTKIEGLEKIIWILIIAVVGFVTMPIYWYVHIWKEGSIRLFRMGKGKDKESNK